jgi:hypothetical protein
MQATFTVENLEHFTSKLTDLQRKAKRHNLFVPAIVSQESKQVKIHIGNASVNITEYTIVLEFENLVVDKAQLIARINHVENIVNVVPGQTLPKEYLHSIPKCDHCQQNRQRNDTFVVQLSNGNYMQIGRNCLGLYLEIDIENALHIADMVTEISELDDYDYSIGGYSSYNYDLDFTLALTCYALRNAGYKSRAQAREDFSQSTSDIVMDLYFDCMKGIINLDLSEYTPTVKAVKEYMLTLFDSNQEYELNLYNIAVNNYVTRLTMGYTVSAVNAYNGFIAKQIKIASKHKTDVGFYGKLDDKFTPKNPLVAKVIRLGTEKSFESAYGVVVKRWYTLQNDAGYVFTWYSETGKMQLDQDVIMTGKIVDYSVYDGISQTVLKNCRIKENVG